MVLGFVFVCFLIFTAWIHTLIQQEDERSQKHTLKISKCPITSAIWHTAETQLKWVAKKKKCYIQKDLKTSIICWTVAHATLFYGMRNLMWGSDPVWQATSVIPCLYFPSSILRLYPMCDSLRCSRQPGQHTGMNPGPSQLTYRT